MSLAHFLFSMPHPLSHTHMQHMASMSESQWAGKCLFSGRVPPCVHVIQANPPGFIRCTTRLGNVRLGSFVSKAHNKNQPTQQQRNREMTKTPSDVQQLELYKDRQWLVSWLFAVLTQIWHNTASKNRNIECIVWDTGTLEDIAVDSQLTGAHRGSMQRGSTCPEAARRLLHAIYLQYDERNI